jgi:hypothetical protein
VGPAIMAADAVKRVQMDSNEIQTILKDRIRRLEGRGEWGSIKILHENSAYVTNLTQHASLLTRSRLYNYR